MEIPLPGKTVLIMKQYPGCQQNITKREQYAKFLTRFKPYTDKK